METNVTLMKQLLEIPETEELPSKAAELLKKAERRMGLMGGGAINPHAMIVLSLMAEEMPKKGGKQEPVVTPIPDSVLTNKPPNSPSFPLTPKML